MLDEINIPTGSDFDNLFLETNGADLRELAGQACDIRQVLGCENVYEDLNAKSQELGRIVANWTVEKSSDVFEQVALYCMLAQTCVLTAAAAVDSANLSAAIMAADVGGTD